MNATEPSKSGTKGIINLIKKEEIKMRSLLSFRSRLILPLAWSNKKRSESKTKSTRFKSSMKKSESLMRRFSMV